MKKNILSLFIATLITSISFGQLIEIHHDGEVLESPESVVDGTVGAAAVFQGYYVVNVSGSPLDFSWQRVAEFSQSCMDDQICTDDSCYPSSYDVPVYNAPESLTLAAGDSTYFKVGASSSDDPCCAIHKYYLKTGLGVVQDSIMVKFRIGATECFLSTDELEEVVELNVYPNPANAILTIEVSAVYAGSALKIYNVLGEEIVSRTINTGKNTINIESLPNGVYFYALLKDGEMMETKKLIVKH